MNIVKFKHVRDTDRHGKIHNMGGFTVAYIVNGNQIDYAIAQCSEHDNFNKHLGRQISAGRLHSPRYVRHIVATEKDFHSMF